MNAHDLGDYIFQKLFESNQFDKTRVIDDFIQMSRKKEERRKKKEERRKKKEERRKKKEEEEEDLEFAPIDRRVATGKWAPSGVNQLL